MSYRDLENFGENIKEVIEDAVSSQSYQKLNQSITQMVNEVLKPYQGKMPKDLEREQLAKKRQEEQEMYGQISGYRTASILKTVFGGILSFVMGNAALGFSILHATNGIGWGPELFSLLFLAGGLGLLVSGIRGIGRSGRFKKYRKAIAGRTYCEVKQLARAVGKPVNFVKKELKRMIADGWFTEGHMDQSEDTLITTDETFRQYQETERQYRQTRQAKEEEQLRTQQKKAGRSPEVEEVLSRGNVFLEKIHKSNDAIPGEEISEKISRMEQIIQQIFVRAEEHPEVIPDLKRMMDYYLPTTVKLLDAYEDMDRQAIQGDNIRSSKKEIEDTLDTLNQAFEKLLDSIFQDTAWDVSSDISVLNTVLAQEGLTESAFQVQAQKR